MPDYGSLEGGWGHIEMGPQQFIDYLLTPRHQQRTTQFAGGSHYGPDREATIPAENYAQAKAMLDLMAQKEQQERASMLTQQADEIMRRMRGPGPAGTISGSFGGQEFSSVPGAKGAGVTDLTAEYGIGGARSGRMQEPSPADLMTLAAAGYQIPGVKGGPQGQVDPTKKYGEETERAKELREGITYLDGQIASLDPKDPRLAQLQRERDQLAALYLQTVGVSGGPGGREVPPGAADDAESGWNDWSPWGFAARAWSSIHGGSGRDNEMLESPANARVQRELKKLEGRWAPREWQPLRGDGVRPVG